MIEKALKVLKKYYGYSEFRKGQQDIITSILNKQNTIGIMPTGGGKSICYQIPAVLFEGVTLVVSPLISLMKDQVDTLNSNGINATFINSSLSYNEIDSRIEQAIKGKYKIIYLAPERLLSENFIFLINRLNISMVAIDEAHCISQWGHDFRPSYQSIKDFIYRLNSSVVVSAFTATATPQVKDDIIKNLELKSHKLFITGFDRPNLSFTTIIGEDKKSFVREHLFANKRKSGIIYISTRKDVEKLYEYLTINGFKVGKYHAGMSSEERKISQDNFSYDKFNIMLATNAFGMGIDKSNVRFVIHYNMPKNIESYYQEAGRAGRDGDKSECILLFSPQDIFLQKFFIENSEGNELQRENDSLKLESMIEYCYTSSCLRSYILKYFGENVDFTKCNNCSNCNVKEEDLVDITIEAQKILSCVVRIKERFGFSMIVSILRGSKNKKVLQYNFDKLSTYNLMNEFSNKDISNMINALVSDQILLITKDTYPVVKLLPLAKDVLSGNRKVFFKKRIIAKSAKSESTSKVDIDDSLFALLRKLRLEIATTNGVPPYIIFSDATLKEMCIFLPTDEEKMLMVKGIGEKKFESYGKVFLTEIIKYVKEKNIDPEYLSKQHLNHTSIKVKNKKQSNYYEDKLKPYQTTYKLYSEGLTLADIAKDKGVKQRTIEGHLIKAALEGEELRWNDIFTKEQEVLILKKAKEVGSSYLSNIKSVLPQEISYFQIQTVLCKNN